MDNLDVKMDLYDKNSVINSRYKFIKRLIDIIISILGLIILFPILLILS